MQQRADTSAASGLVLGLCAVILPFPLPAAAVLALACGIAGIVTAGRARKEQPSGLATAGFILSIIGTALSGALIILFGIALVMPAGSVSVLMQDLGQIGDVSADGPRMPPG